MTKPSNPWPSIDPGSLRHQVRIQQQSATPDASGQLVQTWTTARSTCAGINLVSLKEAFGDGQFTAQEVDIWTMRYSAAVSIAPGMRLVLGSKTWVIQAVDNVGQRNITLHLLCIALNSPS